MCLDLALTQSDLAATQCRLDHQFLYQNNQENITDLKSDDGSSELYTKIGNFYDNLIGTIKSLEDPEERKEIASRSKIAFIENAPEILSTQLLSFGANIENAILKTGLVPDKLKKEFEDNIIETYSKLDKMKASGEGLAVPKGLKEAVKKQKGEDFETVELKQKTTGAGFVE